MGINATLVVTDVGESTMGPTCWKYEEYRSPVRALNRYWQIDEDSFALDLCVGDGDELYTT